VGWGLNHVAGEPFVFDEATDDAMFAAAEATLRATRAAN
jgi:hypothetical protein